ncbi:hypothetical protein DMENIID0001_041580 [Sergentomyia squamirostris]
MRNNLNLYSLKERIYLVKTFYKSECNVSSVKSDFILEFGSFDDIPPDSLIYEVIDLFEETGSVREVPNAADHDDKDFQAHLVGNDDDVWTDVCPDNEAIVKLEESEHILVKPLEVLVSEEVETKVRKSQRRKQAVKKEILKEEVKVESLIPDILEEPIKKKKKLKRFIKKEERDKCQLSCAICGKKMVNKNGLRLHMMLLHCKKEGISCDHCQKSINTMYDLRLHRKQFHKNTPSKERPLIHCPECPRTFLQACMLRKHMLKHSDVKSEMCDVCGKSFKTRHSLKHHMTIHTGEKKFKCDYLQCNRAFRDRNSFEIHKRTHTGEKPYPCEHCGKGFTDKTTLKIHYRQHTGENPYSCELCGKTTKQKQNLRSHMKHFHKIQNPK